MHLGLLGGEALRCGMRVAGSFGVIPGSIAVPIPIIISSKMALATYPILSRSVTRSPVTLGHRSV